MGFLGVNWFFWGLLMGFFLVLKLLGWISFWGVGGLNCFIWFFFFGFLGLNGGVFGFKLEFLFFMVVLIFLSELNFGIVGLFLKLGRVNFGFCGFDCFGRMGVVLFVGELLSLNKGFVIKEWVWNII